MIISRNLRIIRYWIRAPQSLLINGGAVAVWSKALLWREDRHKPKKIPGLPPALAILKKVYLSNCASLNHCYASGAPISVLVRLITEEFPTEPNFLLCVVLSPGLIMEISKTGFVHVIIGSTILSIKSYTTFEWTPSFRGQGPKPLPRHSLIRNIKPSSAWSFLMSRFS